MVRPSCGVTSTVDGQPFAYTDDSPYNGSLLGDGWEEVSVIVGFMTRCYPESRDLEEIVKGLKNGPTFDEEIGPHVQQQGVLKHAFQDGDKAKTEPVKNLRQAVCKVMNVHMFKALYSAWDLAVSQLKTMATREHIGQLPAWWSAGSSTTTRTRT